MSAKTDSTMVSVVRPPMRTSNALASVRSRSYGETTMLLKMGNSWLRARRKRWISRVASVVSTPWSNRWLKADSTSRQVNRRGKAPRL